MSKVRPKLLDLFCGGGGAAIGYYQAGFDVTGVDIKRQSNYPFPQIVADATRIRVKDLQRFDIIHASPPCQGYSLGTTTHRPGYRPGHLGKDEPKLIAPMRELLEQADRHYVIENVMGAYDDMEDPILLCGTMFGLPIARHRLFELTLDLGPFDIPAHPMCKAVQKKFAEGRGISTRHMSIAGNAMGPAITPLWRELMGWPEEYRTSQRDLKEAIPPAYSKWIGEQFLEVL